MLLPLLIAGLVLGLAYLVFYVAPVILDFGKSFMAVVFAFLLIFAGAAFYVMTSLPAIGSTSNSGDVPSIVVSDVVVSN
jgi:hypothetical protein